MALRTCIPALLAAQSAIEVSASEKPHLVFVLVDDWGWNNAGYHRTNDPEVSTPNVNRLVKEGIELDRHYVYMWCAPSRSSLQSGRLPVHVTFTSDAPSAVNPDDPVSGYSGIPRNMTGLATKLRRAGYRTHATGKWDAGMATWEHTPMGRGYETFFGYFHHANDYWTQAIASSGPHACPDQKMVDLWNTTGPARNSNGTGYEEELFLENTLGIIDRHNPKEPLFLFHAFHQIHTPLEVPAAWEQQFDFLKNQDQRKYAAMVAYMDNSLGKIVEKLQERSMWQNTLMVVSSDNGGPNYFVPLKSSGSDDDGLGAANNLPLRGGKFSDWEGGIRVNAFVTGGAVPVAKRGSILGDTIHISDWYTTFCSIAGVDPHDAQAAAVGLPPVDGLDQSALLLGDAMPGSGNRTETHISVRALLQGRWKLLTGGLEGLLNGIVNDPEKAVEWDMGVGFLPLSNWGLGYGKLQAFRNELSLKACAHGCLFDVQADPTEHHDVAWRHPGIVKAMKQRLTELNTGAFHPPRGKLDARACSAWQGFYGPWIDVPQEYREVDVALLI